MTFSGINLRQGRRETTALAAFMLLQSVAAIFFVGDAFTDLVTDVGSPHSVFEFFVAFVLIVGIFLAGWQLRLTLERLRHQERALGAARGDLARIIDTQFAEWGLTPAESDVGLLALKGLDLSEIAQLRGAAQGTVRAQLTRIYAKAGVSGRHQFAAWFVEDLLQDGLSAKPQTVPQD
ncbi:helix-turn-helix transcriptional regulator [Roseibium aggregatum]|jgi:DNA-binding CsgD family transcriptional regulator|uniref:Transcriptional regulator, LuxR family protein n=1 Tax=Roseibium aggregatum (strain ATCC 25650 / DSM 13394 / JCM 20685 / NBRC 16684 / NCIMB 2208 / IAM 12614 / B1) TaxID=384765 RepID=A0NX26_ROSAI|nr:helix-turn-helix transcriptional regulator [Roseibium aggregatum]EAV42675.1 transcriptional regulator, LuxR family protein [Stappia aggregata IAM 12614] [Roseibium aggregatum IAM 12614]